MLDIKVNRVNPKSSYQNENTFFYLIFHYIKFHMYPYEKMNVH